MRPQEEAIVGIDGMNQQRDFPNVILLVVTADSENRRMVFDSLTRAFYRVQFRAFDVHLDISGNFVLQARRPA